MIYRGTTPKLKFKVKFDTSLLDKAYITFFQKDRYAFEKDITACEVEENSLIVKLSQSDTLKLVSKYPVIIQIRALLNDGTSLASKYMEKEVHDVLKDGEI